MDTHPPTLPLELKVIVVAVLATEGRAGRPSPLKAITHRAVVVHLAGVTGEAVVEELGGVEEARAALVVVLDLTRIEAAALPQGFDRTRKVCVVLPTAPQHWEGCDSIPTYINIPAEVVLEFAEKGFLTGTPEDTLTALIHAGICFAEGLEAKLAPICEKHARWLGKSSIKRVAGA